MEEQFQQIPLDKIIPSLTNPRHPDDYKDEDMKSLALSIAESGLIQPVRVRPDKNMKGRYELIIGERRFRAHKMKESGKTTIDAIVCNYTDEQVIVAQNIENIQRKNVHALDEAKSFRALLDLRDPTTKAPKFTVESIVDEIGKDKSYVWKTLVLNNLSEVFHKNFRSGKITRQIAMMIARQSPEQQEMLAEWVDNQLSYNYSIDPEDLECEIESEFHLELAGAPFDKGDATLVEAAGPCTTCAKSTANAPDLFDDLGKKAKCTDSACFKLKKEATFERNIKMLRSSGKVFVIINSEKSGTKNILGYDEFKPAKKSDKGAVQAIHNDDKKRGALEWVKPSRIPMKEEENGAAKMKAKPKRKEKSWDEEQKERRARELESRQLLKPVAEQLIKAVGITKLNDQQKEQMHRFVLKAVLSHIRTGDLTSVLISQGAGEGQLLKHLQKSLSDEHIIFLASQIRQNGFEISWEGKIEASTWKLCKSLGVNGEKIVEEQTKALKAAAAEAKKSKPNDVKTDAEETKRAEEHSKKAGTIGGVGRKSLALPEKEVPAGGEDLTAAEKRTKAKKGGKKK